MKKVTKLSQADLDLDKVSDGKNITLGITKEKYDTLLEKYKRIQADTLLQMEQHSKADENYCVEASKLLELAHRAYELFEISEATQKRELISFLLQNCKMDDKKLIPSLKMPFDQILLANKTQNWLHAIDDVRTYYLENMGFNLTPANIF